MVPVLAGSPSTTAPPNGATPTKIPAASIAFGLGWHTAELYHFEWREDEEPSAVDSLPGISQLPVAAKADLVRIQIAVALEKLGYAELGDDLQARGQSDTSPPAVPKETVYAFHMRVLPRLTAEESSLGKAYDLGRALAETALAPGLQGVPPFAMRFSAGRVQPLKSELSDLRSRFPLHAGEAVEMTLDAWQQWAKEKKLDPNPASWNPKQERAVAQALHRQGEVWYALLAGDMDPSSLLTVNDYLAAIKSIFTAISGIAWSFLARVGVRRGTIVLGIAALIAIIALYKLTGQISSIIWPLLLLLGLLGISVGAVTSALRQALQQASAGLWDAELLNSIAHAVIHLPQL